MSEHPSIRVAALSKKFARSTKRTMVYGLKDIARAVLIPARFRSDHLSARIADAARETSNPERRTSIVEPRHPNTPAPHPESDGLRPSEFWALRDVTFDVQPGECVGIIGANGAGKSTLFSVLSGIYGPSEGRVELRGRLQALIQLGAGFHPMLTGRENIYINAAILGLTQAEINARLQDILAFADLGEFIDAPIRTYSSGMLVRLGFGVAAHLDPDIMLVDEILAVGDASFQQKCQDYSMKLVNSGRTMLLVAHNMLVIQAMCTRVLWMDHGRVLAVGEAQPIIHQYKEFMAAKWEEQRNRQGSGDAGYVSVIRSVEMTDETGRPVETPRLGEALLVRIRITARETVPCARLWLTVSDADRDQPVVAASMHEDGHYLRLSPGENVVTLTLRRLPVMPGRAYRIYTGLRDWACHAMLADSYATPRFAVEGCRLWCENGVGQTRRMDGMGGGVVAVPYAWEAGLGAVLKGDDYFKNSQENGEGA